MAQHGSGKGSSEQTQETLKKILSVTGQVLRFIGKWCLIASFWIFVFSFSITIGILLTAMGIKAPEFKPPQRRPRFNPEQFRKEVENMKLKDLLKEFHEELEQLEQLENQRELEPEQERVVRKLRTFDRSKYDRRLSDVFDEEELEKLILLLLTLLGVEVR